MKTSTKRIMAAACVFAVAGIIQWVAGLPFDRSPQQATFFVISIIIAAWIAAWPGFDE